MARFRRLRRLSSWRRVSLHAWSEPSDPTIYGLIEVDAQNALDYCKEQSRLSGTKVTLTHLVGKAAAEAIALRPEVNAVIRRGCAIYERDSIDVFFQVAFDEGEDLSGAKVEAADRKSVVEIGRELDARAERVRAHRDLGVSRSGRRLALLPARLRGFIFKAGLYLSHDLGLNLSAVGVPFDGFGSVIVTNVGSFGLPHGFAPLASFARVPIMLTVGSVEPRPRAVGDAVKVRPVLLIGAALDHRLLDGYQAGQLAQRFREILENPADTLR